MPGGNGRLDLPEAAGATPGPMPVWYHRPQGFAPDGRVAVMHGLRRDAGRYRDEWREHAEAHGFLLLVPEFSQEKFPASASTISAT